MRFVPLFLITVGVLLGNATAQGLTLVQTTPMDNYTKCDDRPVSFRAGNFNGRCTRAKIEVAAGSTVLQTLRVLGSEEFSIESRILQGSFPIHDCIVQYEIYMHISRYLDNREAQGDCGREI